MTAAIDDYYEQSSLWGGHKAPDELLRLRETLAMVPSEARTVLEVGCGDGFILNPLAEDGLRSRVAGLDGSLSALKHVRTQAAAASAESLPFGDRSWDLVMCLEVLEHLPQAVYARTLAELQRVSARYILITTPNRDDLRAAQVTCPQCACRFNLHRHLRAFRRETMGALFPDFTLAACKTIGKKRRYFMRPTLVRVGRALGILDPFPAHALCPQCGFQRERAKTTAAPPTAPARSPLKSLAKRIAPGVSEGKWILALYHRREGAA